MGCCGRKRQTLRTPTQTGAASWVTMQYREREEVRFLGPTGRAYVFSGSRPIQTVHPRDARALLRSAGFRLL
jgi:hypothetical protein